MNRSVDWPRYLGGFHAQHPGITEAVLTECHLAGVSPYGWLLEGIDGEDRILDIGCGSAPARPHAAGRWLGLDRSGAELAEATARNRGPVVRADAAGLPLATGSITVVTAAMSAMLFQPLDTVLSDEAVPSADVQLIPVASVMAELFLDGPLDGLSLEDLYVDSAPHGTETVYFLASLITYPAVFGEAVPADFEVPDVVHPLVADNFEAINAQIVEILAADGVNTPEPVEPAPVEPEPVEPESIEPEPSEGPAQSDSAPVVQGESAEISQGDVAIIDVLANDSDIDGDALSLVHVGEASFGTVAIVNGQAVYTPDAGYVGSDAFEYIVTDGQNNYVEGSVSLQITASDAGAEPLPVEPDPMPETPEPIEPEPMAAEPAEPTPTPPAENASEGFTASYYELPTTIASLADVDFSAPPSATGIVNSLQYLEVNGSFVPESGEDHYAAQYASVLNVTEAGPHELFLVADDEARISFNGDVVLNATAAQAGEISAESKQGMGTLSVLRGAEIRSSTRTRSSGIFP